MNEISIGEFLLEFCSGIFDFSIMYYIATRNASKLIKNNYISIAGIIFLSIMLSYLKATMGNTSIIAVSIPIIGLFLLVKLNYDIEIFKISFIFGLELLILSIVAFISILVFQLIVKVDAQAIMNFSYFRIAYRVFAKMLEIIPFFWLNKFLSKEKIKTSYHTILASFILIINFILTLVGLKYYSNSDPSDKIGFLYVIFALIVITISSILIIYLSRGIIVTERKELRLESLNKEYKNQLSYLKEIDNLFNDIKKQRHDYINHMEAINSLINNNNFEEAKNYLNNLLKIEENTSSKIRIENKIISSIINFKEKKAIESNINMSYYIDVPNEIKIKDIDVTILLSNALNNAIEACEKLSEGKYIDIYMNYKFEKLKIEINNSFNGEINESANLINTTKLEKSEHGIGLRNMVGVVKKYEGLIDIKIDGNKFTLALMI